jgi:hypothetical protein
MDIVLNVFDDAFFDKLYFGLLERGDGLRQLLSLYFIVTIGGAILYLILATLSYHLIFDKSLMKHKRFIKSQRFLEIVTSLINIPKMAIPTALIFWLQVLIMRPHNIFSSLPLSARYAVMENFMITYQSTVISTGF